MVPLAHLDSALRLAAAALVVSVLAGCIGGDDDGAEEVDSPDATLSAPETLPLQPIDATIPAATLPGEDGGTVDDVVADDTVTVEELTASYERYIECLAEGGGSGRYAHDIELRTGLVVEWNVDDVDGGDAGAVDRDVLGASCSRRYLGDLTRRFELANPPADDLADRQRASIAKCIQAVSPEAAANLPAEISVGTAGDASSLSELQLDPAALDPASLGADADDTAAVSGCIAAVGAEWRPFG
jgi:hypothetical protein